MFKNSLEKISILVLAFIGCLGLLSTSIATTPTTPEQERIDAYSQLSGETGDNGVIVTLLQITNVLSMFAFIICIFKLAQIGFKFMLGPANKKSDAAQSLIPWAIGVFICGLWLPIGNWIMSFFTAVSPGVFDVNL